MPEDAVTSPQPAVPAASEAPPAQDEPDTPVAAETSSDVLDQVAPAGPASVPAGIQTPIPYGQTLGNRYRLDERIATGGMGEVWRGTDELLGRPVAVKLLRAGHMGDEQFRIRFRAEARYAASLSHPGIAQVYDYGDSGLDPADTSGVPYLVMELVEGEPLSAALARDGQLSPDSTLDLVAQAARALSAAHAAGIVHRDIKPGNLLITPDGKIKITDFGIARAALAGAHLTQTGMVMGTAQYVSPEQASALPVTPATDIYSLGVVAYECLTGQTPFTAETPIALALAHVNATPPTLPDGVPAPVAALVMQMLAKRPQARPGSAQLVADRASALRGTKSGDDPWIIGSAALADPSTWFADPSATAAPEPGHSGTAPLAAAPVRTEFRRTSWLRRPAALVLVLAVMVAGLAAGAIVLLASANHPGAAASTRHSGGRGHQTTVVQPATNGSSQQAGSGGQSFTPTTAASSAAASKHPSSPPVTTSVSPTTSISPVPNPDTGATPPISTTPPTTPPTSTSPSGSGGPTAPAGQLANTITQDG
jgi:eukaryotic-like serine/threonine-protein kinase